MNDKQRYVVIGAAVAVALTTLFPPFHIALRAGMFTNMGYHFLFSPPQRSDDYVGSVTVELLLIEWAAIALVSGALWWLFKDKS